jgi:hypothetical protein
MSAVVVVEGDTDEPFVRKLMVDAGLEVSMVYGRRGKAAIDAGLMGFNNAAKGSPWVVFRDLDHDADCAPTFIQRLKLQQSRWMVLRLAVREVESWALLTAMV